MTVIARAVHLAERPVGFPTDATWSVQTKAMAPAEDGEVLVKPTHLSIDPAMRGWVREVPVYTPPLAIEPRWDRVSTATSTTSAATLSTLRSQCYAEALAW